MLVRPHTINLLVENESPSFTFDPLGRLHGAFVAGLNYRRSLDNRVLCKWTGPVAGRGSDSGAGWRNRMHVQ